MQSFFNHIEVSNFKSLRHVELQDCKRINLFIGKPNVGKSNLLEALSLLSIRSYPSLSQANPENWNLRLEDMQDIFYNKQHEKIEIKANHLKCEIKWEETFNHLKITLSDNLTEEEFYLVYNFIDYKFSVSSKAKIDLDVADLVKHYLFDTKQQAQAAKTKPIKGGKKGLPIPAFLNPPFGNNLVDVLYRNENLYHEVATFFEPYGLELVLDKADNTIKVLKRKKNGNGREQLVLFPYTSVADTLQRVIFYKTAISSNENSVLLFEEPEAHAFPPYIRHITWEMIQKKTNQYFVATHSPFIVEDFLKDAREELAIYLVDWKDGETIVKRLSDAQLDEVYNYGIDLFFNLETFL
jgi:AAA15 family ATPase/GTPase